jgi:hypothetical protein
METLVLSSGMTVSSIKFPQAKLKQNFLII